MGFNKERSAAMNVQCFGVYEDDLIDGELSQEWIQCTNDRCEKWMYVECLSTD